MPRKLTDTYLDSLKPADADYFEWDAVATGLGVKVTPAGKRIWVVQLKYPGQAVQSKRTLGHYHRNHGMGIATARAKAAEWHALVKEGKDPQKVEEVKRREAQRVDQEKLLASEREHGNTFRAVAEAYMASRTSKRRALVDEREIRRTIMKAWGDMPIASITQFDVDNYITELAERAPYEAKNAWTHAAGIFRYGVRKGKLTASPMFLLSKQDVFDNFNIGPRKRMLDDDETYALWIATARVGYPGGRLYRWILMTGCRLSEISGARRREFHPELWRLLREHKGRTEEIDWSAASDDWKVFTVPAERFKEDHAHIVPLTDDLCRELAKLPMPERADSFVFSHRGDKPITALSQLKKRIDGEMIAVLRKLAKRRGDDPEDITLENWVGHDLRRVVRSNLAKLGVAREIAEKAIGHGAEGIEAVYNLFEHGPQIRQAMTKWHHRLRKIVSERKPPKRQRIAA
jgi:integrase